MNEAVKNAIPIGRKNAISIDDISRKTGVSKRKCRSEIENINASGETIVINLQDGRGYFIPDSSEQAFALIYKSQEGRRFNSLKIKLEGINRYLNRSKPPKPRSELEKNQMSIFDIIGGK